MTNDERDSERFAAAVKVVLEHEGGLLNDKDDSGEMTDYGVSLRFLRSIGEDINHDSEVDDADILALTKENAVAIYKEYFWNKYHYNEICDLMLAIKIMDISVNMGPTEAHKVVQRALNDIRAYPLLVDGHMGVMTIRSINRFSQAGKSQQVLEQIRLQAINFYKALVIYNPKLKKDLKGWTRRAKF